MNERLRRTMAYSMKALLASLTLVLVSAAFVYAIQPVGAQTSDPILVEPLTVTPQSGSPGTTFTFSAQLTPEAGAPTGFIGTELHIFEPGQVAAGTVPTGPELANPDNRLMVLIGDVQGDLLEVLEMSRVLPVSPNAPCGEYTASISGSAALPGQFSQAVPFTIVCDGGDGGDGEEVIEICEPSSGALDVVFLVDDSGSMGGLIDAIQVEIAQIANDLRERVPDTSFGLATFSDYPGLYGSESDSPYTLQQGITTDLALFQAAVGGISISDGGGGDRAEAYARALQEVVSVNWRDEAQRVVVLVGDTEPHTTNTALGDGLPDPGPDGIVGTADDIDFYDAFVQTRINEITIVGLYAETSSNTPRAVTAFDLVTNGRYEAIPGSPDNITPIILSLINAAVCDPADPTAITLDSFTATATTGGIEVKWVTSAEIDTWGFHLLRSADGTLANAEQVTSEMILAEGRGQSGATYTWLDTSADPDMTYTYWLEETEIDGTTLEYGPSSWAPANPTNTHTVYVPLIQR